MMDSLTRKRPAAIDVYRYALVADSTLHYHATGIRIRELPIRLEKLLV